MKKVLSVFLLAGLAIGSFVSCGQRGGARHDLSQPAVPRTGFVEFREVYASEFTTFDFNNASTAIVGQKGAMITATLVDFDRFGIVQPRFATGWSISDCRTIYTLYLRNDVYWYTVDGVRYAKQTAHDFVGTAQWILTPGNSIINNNLTAVLLNAQEYLDRTITDFSQVGIRALDDYTLQYTLIRPTPWFMATLTHAAFFPSHMPFRERMGVRYGTSNDAMLYSGPYFLSEWVPQVRQVFVRNPNFWNQEENHIDRIERIFNREAQMIAPELFLRGEIHEADIRPDHLAEWKGNPDREWMLHNAPPGQFAMFYAINFDPRFGAEFEPENWRVAVNNINFRRAIFHAIDYVSLAMTIDPYNPEQILKGTISRRGFVFTPDGIDYVDQPELAAFTDVIPTNIELARSYMERAMQELQGRAHFPVTVVLPYNTGNVGMVQRVQLLQQQLERNLGSHFVRPVLIPHPNTGFSIEVRNAGLFSILETSWGPPIPDQLSALEPFNGANPVGWRYGRVFLAEEQLDSNGGSIFQQKLDAADAEVFDMRKRNRLKAEAERFLLENVLVIPFHRSGFENYVSYLHPFTGNANTNGLVRNYLLGKVMLTRPLTTEEFRAAQAQFMIDRAEAHRLAALR